MAKQFLNVLTVAALAVAPAPLAADDEKSDAALSQVAINVEDLDRSEKYYRDVLGFVRVWQYPPESETPIEIGLAAPGGGAGLVLARVNDDPLPEGKGRYGRIIVNTANAKALAAKADAYRKRSGEGSEPRFITIPGDSPPTIVFFRDPDGYEIELYQAPSP
ncbi:MAG: VOC family protein [Gammaproteobacteria bacterium]|nr:VOC family protein [Gammaproteobacteria bacterium]